MALAQERGEQLLDDLFLPHDHAGGFLADRGGAFLYLFPAGGGFECGWHNGYGSSANLRASSKVSVMIWM